MGAAAFDLEDLMGVKRRTGGRSETVSVRLDPKLNYLTELAARKLRRTKSSFIEWAIEQSLDRVKLAEEEPGHYPSIAELQESLWDVDPMDRFLRLAFGHRDLLTHYEQVLWKLIRENGLMWQGEMQGGQWTWEPREYNLNKHALRQHWDLFNAVASGTADPSSLPKWVGMPEAQEDDLPF